MLSKILEIISNNRKDLIFFFVGVFLFFTFRDSVFAIDAALDSETRKTTTNIMTWIGTTISVFLALLTYLSTIFLSPEWINGSLFWLSTYFKQIWILVSNVVYLIFAFILIWIAFMNIIWKWWDKYQLKQALPKFIIGVLIVPFSWFIIQFVLSLSAVLTVSALNLPFETFSSFNNALSQTKIPSSCTLNLKSTWKENTSTGSTDPKSQDRWFFYCEPWEENKKTLDQVLNSWKSSDSIFGIMATYTYWVLGLENIAKLNLIDLANIKTMWDLVIKILFDLLFVIVYSILMIALALVLMTRWIYIWIYIMISPVFWLMYFFDKSSGWWEFFDKFNIKQFISLALVPVFAMLALTFGLLFMYIVWTWMTSWNKDKIDNVSIKDEWGKSIITIWWQSNDWKDWFNLSIIGSPANPQNITDFWKSIWNDALGVIWTLIMKIFGIVVLWWAVMAALRSNEITKAIVEPLHAFGNQVWGLVTKAPQYAPIFGGQSMTSLWTIAWSVQWHVDQKSRDRATNFTNKHMPFLNAWNVWKKADYDWIVDRLNKWSHRDWVVTSDLKEEWIKYLKTIWDTEWARTLNTSEWLKIFAKKVWLTDSEIKSFNFNDKTWYANVIKQIESKFDWNPNVWWALKWEQTSTWPLTHDDIDGLIKWLKDAGNPTWSSWSQTWSSWSQTVTLNINPNTKTSIPQDVIEKSWIKLDSNEISKINWIQNIGDMTKDNFITILSNALWATTESNKRAEEISKFLTTNWITFK